MSFIAPAPAAAEPTIENLPFFPAIELAQVRALVALDGTVTTPRLVHAATEAVISVNRELREWRLARQAEGRAKLEDVPADHIGGKSQLVHLYLRAVSCWAKANLDERLINFDATAKGQRKAEPQEQPIVDYRRDARWAISDIQAIGRTTVELI